VEFSERVVEGVDHVPTTVCTHLPVELVEHVRVEGVEEGAALLCAHLIRALRGELVELVE